MRRAFNHPGLIIVSAPNQLSLRALRSAMAGAELAAGAGSHLNLLFQTVA
jgi:hypothetical protein